MRTHMRTHMRRRGLHAHTHAHAESSMRTHMGTHMRKMAMRTHMGTQRAPCAHTCAQFLIDFGAPKNLNHTWVGGGSAAEAWALPGIYLW